MQLDQGFPLISLDGHRFNHTKVATTFVTHYDQTYKHVHMHMMTYVQCMID